MKSKKLLKWLLFAFLWATIFATIVGVYELTRIRHIVVVDSSNRDLRSLDGLKKRNLLFLDTKSTAGEIRKENPSVKTVTLEKVMPSTLSMKVSYYTPTANFAVRGGYFILSEQATILEKKRSAPDTRLPEIRYYQDFDYYAFQPGAYLDYKDIVSSIFFLQKALDLNLRVDNIDINGLNMIVFSLPTKRILFTTEKDLEKQAYELQSIIRQFKMEGKDFEELDLRFDRPVIRSLQS